MNLTYEDYCDLTDGRHDRSVDDDEACLQSLFATEPGGEMEAMQLEGGDGDERDRYDLEEVEAALLQLDDRERAIVAGNALASCPDDIALISVLEWVCKAHPACRATVAKQAAEMVVNRFNKACRGSDAREVDESLADITELLAAVSPAAWAVPTGEVS